MYLARNAPPNIARDVATRCPTMAPLATPHGDYYAYAAVIKGHLEIRRIIHLMPETFKNYTCDAPKAIVASIERSPHS